MTPGAISEGSGVVVVVPVDVVPVVVPVRQETGSTHAAREDDGGERARRSAGERQNGVAEAFHANGV